MFARVWEFRWPERAERRERDRDRLVSLSLTFFATSDHSGGLREGHRGKKDHALIGMRDVRLTQFARAYGSVAIPSEPLAVVSSDRCPPFDPLQMQFLPLYIGIFLRGPFFVAENAANVGSFTQSES